MRRLLVSPLILALTACSPNFSNENLTPALSASKTPLPYTLDGVTVQVAKEDKQIGDVNFGDDAAPTMEAALTDALRHSGTFSQAGTSHVKLSAEILSLGWGAAGDQILPTRASSTMDTAYALMSIDGRQITHFQIHSFCSKGVGDEFVGIQRRNVAIECSIRKNIADAVTKIQSFQAPTSVAASP